MGDLIRNRVQLRLDALGINPFEAARIAGFERVYFYDLLNGKKHTIREKKLLDAARALQCDPDYLLGRQDRPRVSIMDQGYKPEHTVQIVGVCEADAWRPAGYALPDFGPIPVDPDPRYSVDDQEAYIVRGEHALGLGINDGALLCIVKTDALEDVGRSLQNGDIVLVRHKNDDLSEITARVFEKGKDGVRLSAKPVRGEIIPLEPGDDVIIIGLVLRAIRVFGQPA